jgi:hypothetical protein
MDDHNSLIWLRYRLVNVLYNWTIFLLLNTFWQEWSRLVTLCNVLLYIINFDLYTVSMTFFEQPNTKSHFLTLFHLVLILLLNTFFTNGNALLRFVTNYTILSVLTSIPSLRLFLIQGNTMSQFFHVLYIWTLILLMNTFWHVWSRLVTLCNELLYNISIDLYSDSKPFFHAT